MGRRRRREVWKVGGVSVALVFLLCYRTNLPTFAKNGWSLVIIRQSKSFWKGLKISLGLVEIGSRFEVSQKGSHL